MNQGKVNQIMRITISIKIHFYYRSLLLSTKTFLSIDQKLLSLLQEFYLLKYKLAPVRSFILLSTVQRLQNLKEETDSLKSVRIRTRLSWSSSQSDYFLYPLEALLPLALSNFLPLDLTKGLAWELGTPGAPKCLTALRALRGPDKEF